MAEISNFEISLSGFYANDTYQMFELDNKCHAILLKPYQSNQDWLNYVNSPENQPTGRSNNLPLENPLNIQVIDIKKFESLLKKVRNIEYEINSSCPFCDKNTNIAWGFKIGEKYFIYSDLLLHMIAEHNIEISSDFATGLFLKLNPWHYKYNIIGMKFYKKSEAPVGSSMIAVGEQNITDNNKITINMRNTCPTLNGKNDASNLLYSVFTYPLNPSIWPRINENNYDSYLYANIGQEKATPENPQLARCCGNCIGMAMRQYGLNQKGLDYDYKKSNHSPALWDGSRFIKPSESDPNRLCGQQ